jgi:hypothetical protein
MAALSEDPIQRARLSVLRHVAIAAVTIAELGSI